MKKIIISVILIILILGLAIASTYHKIILKYKAQEVAWEQVEHQLEQRNDLLPEMVSAIKGYAPYEQGAFEAAINARPLLAKASALADKVKAANETDKALNCLLFVVENYPALKTEPGYSKLSAQLASIQNRIRLERIRYNKSVQDFNMLVRTFPGNLVSAVSGYHQGSEYLKE